MRGRVTGWIWVFLPHFERNKGLVFSERNVRKGNLFASGVFLPVTGDEGDGKWDWITLRGNPVHLGQSITQQHFHAAKFALEGQGKKDSKKAFCTK